MRTFSGRSIDVPSMFIGGKSDWGVYQTPGAVDKMRTSACTRMVGFHLVDGAGHWVQQEQPEQVSLVAPGVSTQRKVVQMTRASICFALFALLPAAPASAQLLAAKDGPVVYGHHHLNVTSIDAHKKFWVDALGGKSVKVGTSPTESSCSPTC